MMKTLFHDRRFFPPAPRGATPWQTFAGAWNHFWFRQGPPHLLAVFRIVFGVWLLFYFGLQLPSIVMLYSREGIHLPLFTPSTALTLVFTPPPPWVAWTIFLTFYAAIALFTVGALTRVMGWVVVILYAYYWILSLWQFGTSFDRLFLFIMLILAPSGCNKTFSVDMRVKHGSWLAWEPISIVAQRILAVQVMMTYLGVGWQKLYLPAWQTGKVLSVGFMGRWATPPAWWIARLNLPLPFYDVMTWAIKVFECTIPFGLWSRKFRWWFFAGGAAFHIGISILLNIWWFLPLIPAYILFFEPEEVQMALKRWMKFA